MSTTRTKTKSNQVATNDGKGFLLLMMTKLNVAVWAIVTFFAFLVFLVALAALMLAYSVLLALHFPIAKMD